MRYGLSEAREKRGGAMTFVLIIEDQPLHAKLFSEVIRAVGLSSVTALTGNDGLAIANATKPDLIIVDIRLPDRPGYEIISALRASPENILVPIIAITAATEYEFKTRSADAGADIFLEKPVRVSHFSEVVLRLLLQASCQKRPHV
ncbi:response regulator [Sphingomonas sp. H160509]|jgi:two-component system cell cycle response regulator DivK|nr:response regulator [Sphingomonas sp. H160509]MDD1453108.1 response regulator [Sphingomonas sp. H160509]